MDEMEKLLGSEGTGSPLTLSGTRARGGRGRWAFRLLIGYTV